MPRPGAAKGVVLKNGIGIAFWIDEVPGKADMVNVDIPSTIAAGISRRGMAAARNSASMGGEHEEDNEQADTTIGDQRAGEHDRKHHAALSQCIGHEIGDCRNRAAVFHELAEYEKGTGEELIRKAGSAEHENSRPVGEQWFAEESGDKRSSRRK